MDRANTFIAKSLRSALEITELIELNVQRERTEPTNLMKGCVLRPDGGSGCGEVGSMRKI